MIDPVEFKKTLNKNDFNFFTGVPDSVLKHFTNTLDNEESIIAVNEGSALGISIGYNLATNKIPVVYLQNSGLGNLVNPYLSISAKNIYDFPVLFIIGWRGKPGQIDAPQHFHQGKVTPDILKLMDIKVFEINSNNYSGIIKNAKSIIESGQNVAILVEINQFKDYKSINENSCEMQSIDAINIIKQNFINHYFISSTGLISRELYSVTESNGYDHSYNFLNPGGMGHTLPIASTLSKFSNKPVVCIDGDGSLLMHLGNLHSMINIIKPQGFKYFLLNNNSHDSVGGQSTQSFEIDFKSLVCSIGEIKYVKIDSIKKLKSFKPEEKDNYFIELVIGKRLGEKTHRPKEKYVDLKQQFIKNISAE